MDGFGQCAGRWAVGVLCSVNNGEEVAGIEPCGPGPQKQMWQEAAIGGDICGQKAGTNSNLVAKNHTEDKIIESNTLKNGKVM